MISSATMLGLGGVLVLVATTTNWFMRARRVAIPSNRTLFLLGWAAAGVLGVAALADISAGWLSYILGGLSLLGSLFLLGLYTLRNQNAPNPIMVGDTVPAFEALDDQGRTYTSDALLGTPTLLKFFSGHW